MCVVAASSVMIAEFVVADDDILVYAPISSSVSLLLSLCSMIFCGDNGGDDAKYLLIGKYISIIL